MSTKSEVKYRGLFERPAGSGIWWIRWHDAQGRRHREKIGSKAAAITLYRKRKTEVLQHKKLPELRPRVVSFGEIAAAALAYSETRNRDYRGDKCRMARPLGWWRDRAADSLTPREIEEHLSRVAEWSDGTRNRVRSVLSVAYKLAIRDGKLKENPVRLFPARPERNVRHGFIDDAQYSKLTRATPALWLRSMLALGYTFGWRARELTGLRVCQVDSTAQTLRLEPGTTKNFEGRTIRLTRECLELTKACMLGKNPSDFLFTREDGRPIKAYRHAWEQLCARAGLGSFVCKNCQAPGPVTGAAGRLCRTCTEAKQVGVYRYEGLLFHDLRRSAVRNLERAGVPRSFAMKLTGHKTEAVYRRYAIVSESDMADAVGRLERMRLNAENEGAPLGAPASNSEVAMQAKVM